MRGLDPWFPCGFLPRFCFEYLHFFTRGRTGFALSLSFVSPDLWLRHSGAWLSAEPRFASRLSLSCVLALEDPLHCRFPLCPCLRLRFLFCLEPIFQIPALLPSCFVPKLVREFCNLFVVGLIRCVCFSVHAFWFVAVSISVFVFRASPSCEILPPRSRAGDSPT